MISGICATLGRRSVRRGVIVVLCGLVCTAVTYGMYRFGMAGKGLIIYFGVLHCLGICMLLWGIFSWLPAWALGVLGAVLAAVGLLVFPGILVEHPWLIPLGIRFPRFASSDYFPILPNLGYFLVGALLHKLQGQFINRENDREALKSIIKCIQILKEDKGSIAVFPEGGIHDDRKFHHFRPGVFKIAQKAGVPIVVCTLKNTRDMITNLLHYKRSDTEFSVLTVLQPEDYAQLSTTELAEQIYELMAADLGPENVAQE